MFQEHQFAQKGTNSHHTLAAKLCAKLNADTTRASPDWLVWYCICTGICICTEIKTQPWPGQEELLLERWDVRRKTRRTEHEREEAFGNPVPQFPFKTGTLTQDFVQCRNQAVRSACKEPPLTINKLMIKKENKLWREWKNPRIQKLHPKVLPELTTGARWLDVTILPANTACLFLLCSKCSIREERRGGTFPWKLPPPFFASFSNAAPDVLSYIPASFKDMFLNPIQNADSHWTCERKHALRWTAFIRLVIPLIWHV